MDIMYSFLDLSVEVQTEISLIKNSRYIDIRAVMISIDQQGFEPRLIPNFPLP